ncbi:DNA mismatch repair protein MutS [Clostridia bacterium]|nr:DNA mismatch repair protein MutS [Clostridia bacterium]
MAKSKISPMMQQYFKIKENYQDCLLFFRLGDFYEMFFDDAIEAAQFLDITLTGRDWGQEDRAPMCGVPFHSAQNYIDRLIAGGYRVAICEQTEDATASKDLVQRDVVRVITAGTVTSDGSLDTKSNNYLCSVYSSGNISGLAAVDITTGELSCTEIWGTTSETALLTELSRYSPSEVVVSNNLNDEDVFIKTLKLRFNCIVTCVSENAFDSTSANQLISQQFGKNAPKMGDVARSVVGSLLKYLAQTQMCSLPHINTINFYNSGNYMQIDYASKRNLEIIETMREGKRKGSLLGVLDKTCTSMGGRLLRNWLDKPLVNSQEIKLRQEAVNTFYQNPMLCDELRGSLSTINDIERLTSKISTRTATPRDLASLCVSIEKLPRVRELAKVGKDAFTEKIADEFDELFDIYELISRSIITEPPVSSRDGGIIKEGFNEQVDKYRSALTDGSKWLEELEAKEKERTGIKTLKIAFNRVAGYYIEVSKLNSANVPERYVRKSTLANAERYITGELKEIENTILGATERNSQLEHQIFMDIVDKVSTHGTRILRTAANVASLDVLASLAKVAQTHGYIKPEISADNVISVKDGRHPVVENSLDSEHFVPNDTHLNSSERIAIITGPNMAGKSTYMRQVAIIVLLAQIGSFVPASSAKIGVVDKIFTRVGAADDLAAGQSTFMVEMMEVSNILKNATQNSLVILDEIGRGTSTYDGLAIAWSVVEHIADTDKIGAKTLFATHYHELTELEGKVNGVRNYCVTAEKRNDGIVFLRKIMHGGADDSYGIEVAKLAGVNDEVVNRAHEIVMILEGKSKSEKAG